MCIYYMTTKFKCQSFTKIKSGDGNPPSPINNIRVESPFLSEARAGAGGKLIASLRRVRVNSPQPSDRRRTIPVSHPRYARFSAVRHVSPGFSAPIRRGRFRDIEFHKYRLWKIIKVLCDKFLPSAEPGDIGQSFRTNSFELDIKTKGENYVQSRIFDKEVAADHRA